MSVTFYTTNSDHDLNVANGAASKILSAAGISNEELIGTMTPKQALDAAATFENSMGISYQEPTREYRGEAGARIIEIGYDAERLGRYAIYLRQLAQDNETIKYG